MASTWRQIEDWVRCACGHGIPRRALRMSLIVGPILTLINQGDALFGEARFSLLKAMLTFLVPYAVATCSAVATVRR